MKIVDDETIATYTAAGWWRSDQTVSRLVANHAHRIPSKAAFVVGERQVSWREYDDFATEIALRLVELGLDDDARIAICVPDGAEVHAALVATTRAGLIAVGIGARAGDAEVAHLMRTTHAQVLVTGPHHAGRPAAQLLSRLEARGVAVAAHLVLRPGLDLEVNRSTTGRRPALEAEDLHGRGLGPNDLFLLNSTSGTTGLPKCVTQFENRWLHFSDIAVQAGALRPDDVFLGAVPAPFGFGLWTSHFAPAVLGATCVVLPRFTSGLLLKAIESARVTVLNCVSTQFRMLLSDPGAQHTDFSSLRIMFTGGEAVPYQRAVEFEETTGALVLQFFGSNETGAFSCTTVEDPPERRLTTAGRLLDHMDVRLYDAELNDVTASGVGQPAGRGPLTCAGYFADPDGNRALYTPDGRMLMGDVVRVDEAGYLSVLGRTSDIIIRGGKNISAVEVEELLEAHPRISMAAAVAVPDAIFGERVCAVVTVDGPGPLTLDDLTAHLAEQSVSKELYPEHLVIVEEMPKSSGGKVAKAEIRQLAIEAIGERRRASTRRSLEKSTDVN